LALCLSAVLFLLSAFVVVQKFGFLEEGTRSAFLHIAGAWRDHRSFALTADEVPDGLLSRWLENSRS